MLVLLERVGIDAMFGEGHGGLGVVGLDLEMEEQAAIEGEKR